MKVLKSGIFTAAILLIMSAVSTKADVSIGVSADDDGIKSFYMSIGEHYKVPEKEVIVIREQKIPDDDLPVIFFIARHATVEPSVVVKLRLAGKSWMDITTHFGLSPAIYYVAFDNDPGPPYGKAWGYYKNHKKDDWKTIRLADNDVVNFVNIKFMSERHGYSPHEVIKMRENGQGFAKVNAKIKNHKREKHNKQHSDADKPGKAKSSKGEGKGKDK